MTISPTISLCLIAKNEASTLAACLHSVEGLVNEMIVVDTGSTDSTIDIAKNSGAKVFQFDWRDDFSSARNFSLEKATSDWILVLDADEVISKEDHQKILKLISSQSSHFYLLTQTTYCDDNSVLGFIPNRLHLPESTDFAGYVESDLVRLFKKGSKFSGRIHEHVDTGGAQLIKSGIRIHHYGKKIDAARLAYKNDLYLRLGEQKCRDEKDNPKSWYELGVQHWWMKNSAKARESFLASLNVDPGFTSSSLALAVIKTNEGDAAGAIELYLNVLKTDPSNKVPYIALVPFYLRQNKLDEAHKIIEKGSLQQNLKNDFTFCANAARFYLSQSQDDKAFAYYEMAKKLAPQDIEFLLEWAKVAGLYGNESQINEAFLCLEALKGSRYEALARKIKVETAVVLQHFTEALAFLGDEEGDLEMVFYKVVTLVHLGRFEEAQELFGRHKEGLAQYPQMVIRLKNLSPDFSF